jgi:hypothetical protein
MLELNIPEQCVGCAALEYCTERRGTLAGYILELDRIGVDSEVSSRALEIMGDYFAPRNGPTTQEAADKGHTVSRQAFEQRDELLGALGQVTGMAQEIIEKCPNGLIKTRKRTGLLSLPRTFTKCGSEYRPDEE